MRQGHNSSKAAAYNQTNGCKDDETRLGANQDNALSRNYHRRTSKFAAALLSVATCKLMATVQKIICECQ